MRFIALFEAAAVASSLSLDAFTAGFAYGSDRIKLPFLSVQIINMICGLITGLSLIAGNVLAPYLPGWLAKATAFAILFVIGAIKLLDSIIKSVIRKHSGINKEIKISMFNIKFILSLYANPEDADVDFSKTISTREAAALAISLSLDGIAVGFGAAMMSINGWAVFLLSLLTNSAALMLGAFAGGKMTERTPVNISWISGVALIGLAFSKLV